MGERQEAQARLAAALAQVLALRRRLGEDPAARIGWRAVKAFQAQRLRGTYVDLLASDRYHEACEFFLAELYGTRDFGERDRQALAVVPKLARMLPERAVVTMALAVELDHLSEVLDARVAAAIRSFAPEAVAAEAGPLEAAVYARGYREAGTTSEREWQIQMVGGIGRSLEALARIPLLPGLLRMMRGPAEAAGFAELHRFLQSGFDAFRRMGPAADFLAIVARRETRINERLLAGDPDPFSPTA